MKFQRILKTLASGTAAVASAWMFSEWAEEALDRPKSAVATVIAFVLGFLVAFEVWQVKRHWREPAWDPQGPGGYHD